jgi:hypothetical protein
VIARTLSAYPVSEKLPLTPRASIATPDYILGSEVVEPASDPVGHWHARGTCHDLRNRHIQGTGGEGTSELIGERGTVSRLRRAPVTLRALVEEP